MYQRYTRSTSGQLISGLILTLFMSMSYADPWVCSEDLNGDSDIADLGETLDCSTDGLGYLCPISRTSCTKQNKCSDTPTEITVSIAGNTTDFTLLTFDLKDSTAYTAYNITQASYNSVTFEEVCERGNDVTFIGSQVWTNPPGYTGSVESGQTITIVRMPNCANNLEGAIVISDNDNSLSTFLAAHVRFQTTISKCNDTDVCPLGNYECIDVGNGPQCSSNNCYDIGTTNVITSDGPSGDMYLDDGARDANGNCQGLTMIFSGRAMTCQPAGKSNAFQNCCKNSSGEIYYDSTGSSVETALTNKAIVATAQAAYAAYEAFDAARAAGESISAASNAASTAATESLTVAFDPTSLAIAIAIQLVLDYVTQACPEGDLETAMLNGSGYCVYVGEYCETEWEFVGCVQEEKSYCCFNSKLARIIQEQGRPQLPSMGGFGNPKNPDCRGFLPAEFQAIDFSKIDFSEYYNDLRHETQTMIRNTVETGINDFYEQTQNATP